MSIRMTRGLGILFVVAACADHSSTSLPPAADASLPPLSPLPAADLQMTDISILFPLEIDDDYLRADSSGSNGPLVPEALYSVAAAMPYDELRVLGMRLDPCFDQVGPIDQAASCDNQLRLVFQAFDSPGEPFDGGVHVMYRLTRDELMRMAGEIAAARQATAGDGDLGPLSVHPLLATEGLTGTFGAQLHDIILRYADPAQIERITTFGLGADPLPGDGAVALPGGEFWSFGGVVVRGGVATELPITSLGNETTETGVDAAVNPLETSFAIGSGDNLGTLASTSQAMAATAADRQAAFDAALRIESPMHDSQDTTDCVSCHVAEPVRVLVGEQAFGMTASGDANAFSPDPSIPAADLSATLGADLIAQGSLNLHAFSYRFSVPMINQRVINETAENLAYLHSLPAQQ